MMKVHPVADLFPLMEGPEFSELVQDIKDHGLREPIVTSFDQTLVIDGRNRLRACEAAGVTPAFAPLPKGTTEERIVSLIVSSNLRRRHLDTGQRAMIAVSLEATYAALAKERQRAAGKDHGKGQKLPQKSAEAIKSRSGEARNEAAKAVNVSHDSVSKAKRVKAKSKALAGDVLAGRKTLNEADREARKMADPPDEKPKQQTAAAPGLILRTHEFTEVPYPQPKGKSTFNTTNDQVSWAKFTWNPVTGCLHGCRYCYARELANRPSYASIYPVGFTPLFHHERLDAPANTAVPADADSDERLRRVFVCSMADLYGKWVPQEWIDAVHASASANPQWDYLMLTKFPRRYVGLSLPPTAWIGTSVDEQKRVRLAEDAFRQIEGVRAKWLSLEPLLAPLEFSDLSMFDWIVIGSQSATEQPEGRVAEFAPPFEWVSRIVHQAREAGCRVYLKPNLLGNVDPQSPGMALPQEEPLFNGVAPNGRQLRLVV